MTTTRFLQQIAPHYSGQFGRRPGVRSPSLPARPRIRVLRGRWVRATYTRGQVAIYRGNAFIEGLPPIPESDEVIRRLALRPEYDSAERLLSPALRIHAFHAIRR